MDENDLMNINLELLMELSAVVVVVVVDLLDRENHIIQIPVRHHLLFG
jgi:hypothetical protein